MSTLAEALRELLAEAKGWTKEWTGRRADTADALFAKASAALVAYEATPKTEYGWLIENGKKQGEGLAYRFIDNDAGGLFGWTDDPNKALRFARREDAEQFSNHDEDAAMNLAPELENEVERLARSATHGDRPHGPAFHAYHRMPSITVPDAIRAALAVDMTDERAAFEASAGPESVHRQFEKDEDGDYLHAATQIDWRVWQERAALDRRAALEAALMEALPAVTAQAETLNHYQDDPRLSPSSRCNFAQKSCDLRELAKRINALLKKDSGNE